MTKKKASWMPHKAIFSSLILLFVLLVDQVTKALALAFLSSGMSCPIFETLMVSFSWTLVTNPGAAWGMWSFHPVFLFFVRLCIVTVLFLMWKRSRKKRICFFIALIIGGALSNILDWLRYGAVIDFIHVRFYTYSYPVFNIADCAIFIGTVGLLLTYSWKQTSLEERIIHALSSHKCTIACAESCTGGFLSSLLASVPGASKPFLGGVVVYSQESKSLLLPIHKDHVEQHGPVSQETADALARAVQKKLNSDYSVAIVGYLAGGKQVPCGTVFISLMCHNTLFQKRVAVKGKRSEEQKQAALHALEFLAEKLHLHL